MRQIFVRQLNHARPVDHLKDVSVMRRSSALRLARVAAVAFTVGGLTTGASAEEKYCTGQGTPMPEPEVIAKLEQAGYTRIRELEMEHGCYEAKGFDADGNRVEVYVEPATGEIVKIKS